MNCHFQKEKQKLLSLLTSKYMGGEHFFYLFPSTKLLSYILVNCMEEGKVIRDIHGYRFMCFLVQNFTSHVLKIRSMLLFGEKKIFFSCLFMYACLAKLFKLFTNFGTARRFLHIWGRWYQKHLIPKLAEKFVIWYIVLRSIFQRATSKEGDFSIFWGAR